MSNKPEKTKRRILTAGAGIVAVTAVEGLACGNPVSPRYDMPHEQDPTTTAMPMQSAAPEASSDPLKAEPPVDAGASETSADQPKADPGSQ